jgi:hypothetical protein
MFNSRAKESTQRRRREGGAMCFRIRRREVLQVPIF